MPPDWPRPLRLVTDTNVAISGLLWGGAPRQLLRVALNPAKLLIFSSPSLLNELQRVLAYTKLQPRITKLGLSHEALFFNIGRLSRSLSHLKCGRW